MTKSQASFRLEKHAPDSPFKQQAKNYSKSGQYWMHLMRTEDQELIDTLNIADNEKEALMAEVTRPSFWQVTDREFILFLRAVNLNPNSEPEDMVSLRILCDGERLISVMNRPVQAAREIKILIENQYAHWSIVDVFLELIRNVLTKIEKHVKHLMEKVDQLEELEDQDSEIPFHEVHNLRRAVSRLSRFTVPQLESIKKLSASECNWLKENHRQEIREFLNKMNYLNEEIMLIRERSEILNNELSNNISNRANKNLYLISIISVIFLPLSFITGLLGINVGGMPGASSEDGFLIVSIIIVVMGIVQGILMKMFRWF